MLSNSIRFTKKLRDILRLSIKWAFEYNPISYTWTLRESIQFFVYKKLKILLFKKKKIDSNKKNYIIYFKKLCNFINAILKSLKQS